VGFFRLVPLLNGFFFLTIAHPVGATGSSGVFEATDIIFATKGPTAGAIVVEWNMKGSSQGATGLWDSHIRLGGGSLHSRVNWKK
jgi:hypothetical protein